MNDNFEEIENEINQILANFKNNTDVQDLFDAINIEREKLKELQAFMHYFQDMNAAHPFGKDTIRDMEYRINNKWDNITAKIKHLKAAISKIVS